MQHPAKQAAALLGAVFLFLCGFGWYLSMGMWAFSLEEGFSYLAEDEAYEAVYSAENGPFSLTFALDDPKALVGETLFSSKESTITVSQVDNITGTSCRIWFQAVGTLAGDGGTLLSACLPQDDKKIPLLFSSLQTNDQERYTAYLSNYDTALGDRGNQFAVTVLQSRTEEATAEAVTLTFANLQKVTFSRV